MTARIRPAQRVTELNLAEAECICSYLNLCQNYILSLQSPKMRILVQRVFEAWVRVEGTEISRIKQGILVLVGITPGDTVEVAEHMANKALNMRLWAKQDKAWSSSVMDVKGEVMAVSQFTLYGILKGNKPDFHGAMQADDARQLFDKFVSLLKKKYEENKIQTGKFQHLMEVGSVNNGPVTIQYEKTAEQKIPKKKKQQKAIEPKSETESKQESGPAQKVQKVEE